MLRASKQIVDAISNGKVSKVEMKNSSFTEPYRKEIENAKNGDQDAMYTLYSAYAKALLNTSYRIVNSKEDAEDVLQEAFLKAFSSLDQFKFESTFGAWIKRIVIHKSIDILKKNNRRGFIEEQMPTPNQVSDLESDYLMQNAGLLDKLYEALNKLPDGYRTVFSLFMLEGYDHKEIAQILNIGESTSISQLSRAKKKLKSIVLNNE